MSVAKARIETVLLLAGFLSLAALCAVGLLVRHPDDAEDSARRPRTFRRDVLEGLSLRQSGLYGVDLVSCGRLRVEKRKLGPLTLGGLNVLVIDDLRVVIPPRAEKGGPAAPEKATEPKSGASSASREILSRMGLSPRFLKTQGVPARFSGLTVNGLTVSRLDGTNAVPCFTATLAEGVREGLRLEGLSVGGRAVGNGLLANQVPLRLTDSRGETILEM